MKITEAESLRLLHATEEQQPYPNPPRTVEIDWGTGNLPDTPGNQWARDLVQQWRNEPPDGQLCERLRHYETHEAWSATRGPRGAACPRPAKARDANGVWACGVHLGADKRGEQNRERGRQRRAWRDRTRADRMTIHTPEGNTK